MADAKSEPSDELAGEAVYVVETPKGPRERIAVTPEDHVNIIAAGGVRKGRKKSSGGTSAAS